MHRDKFAVFSVWYIFGSFLWEQLNEAYFHDLTIRTEHVPEDMRHHDVLSQKRVASSELPFGFAIPVTIGGKYQLHNVPNVIAATVAMSLTT